MNTQAQAAPKKQTLLQAATKKTMDGLKRRDGLVISPLLLCIPQDFNVRGIGMTTEEYLTQEHIDEYIDRLAHAYMRDARSVPPMLIAFDENGVKPIVIDGWHRFHGLMRAIKNGAKIDTINVIETVGDMRDHNITMLNMGEAIKLTVVEQAEIYARLVHDFKMTVEEIAEYTGKSANQVKRSLKIHDLSDEEKLKIQKGETTAYQSLSTPVQKAQNEFTRKYRKAMKTLSTSVMSVDIESVVVENGMAVIRVPAEDWNAFLQAKAETEEAAKVEAEAKALADTQQDLLAEPKTTTAS